MTRALIGHTGFIGATLLAGGGFTHGFTRADIDEMRGQRFDEIVCAGVPGSRAAAAREPERDRETIARLLSVLETVRAGRFVLISTTAVYADPSLPQDEAAEANAIAPYGRHRLEVERFVAAHFPRHAIVRLPEVFGDGLKENTLFDLLQGRDTEALNPAARQQWYSTRRLLTDLARIEGAGLSLVNLVPEPIALAQIIRRFFPAATTGREQLPAPGSDLRTRHARLFGGEPPYIATSAQVLVTVAAKAKVALWGSFPVRSLAVTSSLSPVVALARSFVRIDSRSFVSNLPMAEAVEAALAGFAIERIDYTDPNGVAKRVLVAHRGGEGGIAFAGHMDTVPDTGWTTDPWSGEVADGKLHGLGSADMKGPFAAAIIAARALPESVPVTLLVTTDEEITKQGSLTLAQRSQLAREVKPKAIIVTEPTSMRPLRGHRSHIHFYATATGVQAHSSTGRGRNANWDLVDFLVEMKALNRRLHEEKSLQDADYDPPFSDFNLVLDNYGTAMNVTVAKATVRIKYRYTAKIDPTPVVAAVQAAAQRAGLTLTMERDGNPPELPVDHPLVKLAAELTGEAPLTAPYGTDAAELQVLGPCVVLGPGSISVAHVPGEAIALAELEAAVATFARLAHEVYRRF